MFQTKEQTLGQKLAAIKDLVKETHYEAVDIFHFNKSDKRGGATQGQGSSSAATINGKPFF